MRLRQSTVSKAYSRAASTKSSSSPVGTALAVCLVAGAIGGVSSLSKNTSPQSARTSQPTYRNSYSGPVSSATASNSKTVYITNTGSKYHASGCQYIHASSISIDLEEAKSRYSPCSVCSGSPSRTEARQDATTEARGFTSDAQTDGTTATGKTIYVGPRGGRYHYSSSGKKVYERRRK